MTSPLLTAEEIRKVTGYVDLAASFQALLESLCHAQLVKVVAWMEEPCNEHEHWDTTGRCQFSGVPRVKCLLCMESLKELVK